MSTNELMQFMPPCGLRERHGAYMVLEVELRIVFKVGPMKSSTDRGHPLFILRELFRLPPGGLYTQAHKRRDSEVEVYEGMRTVYSCCSVSFPLKVYVDAQTYKYIVMLLEVTFSNSYSRG